MTKKIKGLAAPVNSCSAQILSKPEFFRSLLEIRPAGAPVLHQLARKKQKTARLDGSSRSAAPTRVAMYFVFGIAVEGSADYESGEITRSPKARSRQTYRVFSQKCPEMTIGTASLQA